MRIHILVIIAVLMFASVGCKGPENVYKVARKGYKYSAKAGKVVIKAAEKAYEVNGHRLTEEETQKLLDWRDSAIKLDEQARDFDLKTTEGFPILKKLIDPKL